MDMNGKEIDIFLVYAAADTAAIVVVVAVVVGVDFLTE